MNELMKFPNVNGVGRGFSGTTIVLVEKKLPLAALSLEDRIPRRYQGKRTNVLEVGVIRAQPERTDEWEDPVPAGVSVGHHKISAGTFGAPVHDTVTKRPLILSNNHVLANSNNAVKGDTILQPGAIDGGTKVLARLERFIPIEFSSDSPDCNLVNGFTKLVNFFTSLIRSSHQVQAVKISQAINLVDAAVAAPVGENQIRNDILRIGKVYGILPPYLGMVMEKSGRTTGYTTGTITILDAIVNVNYGAGKVATFNKQIITTGMSEPGDSGSLGVTDVSDIYYAVGLLFAGSSGPTGVTIYNPILEVLNKLGINMGLV